MESIKISDLPLNVNILQPTDQIIVNINNETFRTTLERLQVLTNLATVTLLSANNTIINNASVSSLNSVVGNVNTANITTLNVANTNAGSIITDSTLSNSLNTITALVNTLSCNLANMQRQIVANLTATNIHIGNMTGNKFVTSIGTTAQNVYTLNHNLNTADVVVQVYSNSTNQIVFPLIATSTNTVSLSFDTPPGLSAYKVVIIK
jgi:hypothetical protein